MQHVILGTDLSPMNPITEINLPSTSAVVIDRRRPSSSMRSQSPLNIVHARESSSIPLPKKQRYAPNMLFRLISLLETVSQGGYANPKRRRCARGGVT
jgi:hypothetical protein